MHIEDAVKQQHIVALGLGLLAWGILLLHVCGVQVHQRAVLVLLQGLDLLFVFVDGEIVALGVFQQHELFGTLEEFLVGEHAVLHEGPDVVPFLLEIGAVVLEHLLQLVRHLFGDVGGNLLHVGIALQVAAAHVQRNVRRVDDAVQQHQELGHYTLHVVGDEDLVAVELDLVLLHLDALLGLREIEDAGQLERVFDVDVDVEQRLVEAVWV